MCVCVCVCGCVCVCVCVCVQPQWCRGFVLLLLLVKAKTPLVATFPSFSPSLPLNPSYPPAPPTISHFLWLTLQSLFSPSLSVYRCISFFNQFSPSYTALPIDRGVAPAAAPAEPSRLPRRTGTGPSSWWPGLSIHWPNAAERARSPA